MAACKPSSSAAFTYKTHIFHYIKTFYKDKKKIIAGRKNIYMQRN